MIAEGVLDNPKAELVLWRSTVLLLGAKRREECYAQTIEIINEAEAFIEARVNEEKLFGGAKYQSLAAEERRRSIAAQVMPIDPRRGQRCEKDDPDASTMRTTCSQFVNGKDSHELSQVGAACPDHLVHTKVVPLFIDWTPDARTSMRLKAIRESGIAAYKEQYEAYFERNKNEGDVMFEAGSARHSHPGHRHDQHGQELGDGESQRRALPPRDRRHARRDGAWQISYR